MPATMDKVKQIIIDQLGVEESEVTSAASFVDDLGADSLQFSGFVERAHKLAQILIGHGLRQLL